jgi:tyrosinase
MFRRNVAGRSIKWSFLEIEPLEQRALLSPVAIVGNPSPGGVPPSAVSPYVRKNQSSLTSTERDNFINAIKTLKTTYRPGSDISVYDEFVKEHYDAFSAGHAHGGPAFLAWHREFLLQFEQELQTVDPTVTIPYWDFTVDNSPSSSIWDKKFLGGDGDPNDNYIVKTGPFQQGEWTLVYDGPDLRRDFGGLVSTLPTADDVAAAFDATYYDVYPFDTGSPIDQSFRNNLEGFNHPSGEAELHNRVHDWIGGSMAIAYSPNDPVFWLLHANIDRLWAQWQAANPNDQYDPETGAADGQNLNDLMSPFDVTPASVLDHKALGYVYDTELGNNGGGGGSPQAARTLSAAFLASLHGLHAGGTFGAGILQALPTSLAMLGEHDGHLLFGMGFGNGGDFAKPAGMVPSAAAMAPTGGVSVSMPQHTCY